MRTVCAVLLALIFLTGCNLATDPAATMAAQELLTATPAVTMLFQPTLTPFSVVPTLAPGVIATPLPGVIATPIPGTVPTPGVPTQTGNAIEWLIVQIIIPAWNFLYTLAISGAASLWTFAGERGGLTAQLCGCLLPIGIIAGLIIRAIMLRRIRIF